MNGSCRTWRKEVNAVDKYFRAYCECLIGQIRSESDIQSVVCQFFGSLTTLIWLLVFLGVYCFLRPGGVTHVLFPNMEFSFLVFLVVLFGLSECRVEIRTTKVGDGKILLQFVSLVLDPTCACRERVNTLIKSCLKGTANWGKMQLLQECLHSILIDKTNVLKMYYHWIV